MSDNLQRMVLSALIKMISSQPRADLHPVPGTKPLTLEAAFLPPLIYYVALLLLPSALQPATDCSLVRWTRNTLASIAAILFFRLPLAYHVPQSIGLTYQLGLVGIYGACRVVDAFFISAILFKHIPKRVQYTHIDRPDPRLIQSKEWSDGGMKDPFIAKKNLEGALSTPNGSAARTPLVSDAGKDSYFPSTNLVGMAMSASNPRPVYETARTEQTPPKTLFQRALWALELELSMRGVGFTWTTADVRHTRETWLPTVPNRIHSIFVHVFPVLVGGGAIIRGICIKYLSAESNLFGPEGGREVFDTNIPFFMQLVLTLAMGAFLMAAFSLGHSLFAIICSPLAPSQLAFFPPLYTTRVWELTTVRKFWSYGWHRLFARLFLVYGVWPGEWVERTLTGKEADEPADVGKVLGAFLSSAFVHSFAVRGVVAGDWMAASGEAKFFTLNGIAIVMEEVFRRAIKRFRRSRGWTEAVWYDAWIGRVWWIAVVVMSGRNFARGWVKSGLVREMAFL